MNLDIFLKEALKITLSSGDFILKQLGKIKVEFKGRRNIVTWVDKESERRIKDYLNKKFPQIPFLAEELNYNKDFKDLCWVVDPLDGTNNFAHSYPFFCVSCALIKGKEPVLGVVYDPLRKEMFWAKKKGGSFLNGKRIKSSRVRKLKDALLCTGFYYEFEDKKDTNIDHFINFLYASQGVRRSGSAALDLCYVACGRLDGFWELYLNPWDTASGSLIVKEAGGRVSDFEGNNFQVFLKEIVASNGLIHKKMLAVLNIFRKGRKF